MAEAGDVPLTFGPPSGHARCQESIEPRNSASQASTTGSFPWAATASDPPSPRRTRGYSCRPGRLLMCGIGHGLQLAGFRLGRLGYQGQPAGRAIRSLADDGRPAGTMAHRRCVVVRCGQRNTERFFRPIRAVGRSWLIRSTIATRSRRNRCCGDMWPSPSRDGAAARCWCGPNGPPYLRRSPCAASPTLPTVTGPARP